jgi:hypothetical protein
MVQEVYSGCTMIAWSNKRSSRSDSKDKITIQIALLPLLDFLSKERKAKTKAFEVAMCIAFCER